jgi:hypothetical protein
MVPAHETHRRGIVHNRSRVDETSSAQCSGLDALRVDALRASPLPRVFGSFHCFITL